MCFQSDADNNFQKRRITIAFQHKDRTIESSINKAVVSILHITSR